MANAGKTSKLLSAVARGKAGQWRRAVWGRRGPCLVGVGHVSLLPRQPLSGTCRPRIGAAGQPSHGHGV